MICHSFKRNEKIIFEYMHPSTPTQAAAGSDTVCTGRSSARVGAGTGESAHTMCNGP